MLGLWLDEGGLRARRDLPEPVPGPGEALVRVRTAGICRTDLELARGYAGFRGVPGHEFVGEVVAAPGDGAWVGRRVVGEINVSCGACATCRRGHRAHCERREVLGIRGRSGAFAELLALPVANLHAVPDTVPDAAAVFTEPLAAALQVQEQVRVGPGREVTVLGDGKLGSLVAQTLALTGCALTVVGRHPAKLDRMAAHGIATAREGDVAPRSADVVVECTGHPGGLALALRAVRPRGIVVLKSTYAGEPQVHLSPVVVDEVTLVGSRCGPFAPALGLLAAGRIDVAGLVDRLFPLEDGVAALAEAARHGVKKVLLDCATADPRS